MVFKCQENSFLKEFTSKVLSCEKVKQNSIIINGKTEKVEGFEVVLEDTIIFPEGGGQPCDHGYLNDVPVKHVIRKEDKAVHYVNQSFTIGEPVTQTIDWQRRFDHMQQHSGQHLVTAIIYKEFKIPTLSWWLGEGVSYVELDTPLITMEQISKSEFILNELIRDGKTVTVTVYNQDTPEEQLKEMGLCFAPDCNHTNKNGCKMFRFPTDIKLKKIGAAFKVRARGLPADHKGDIRVINIEDVESNMCCGTHVKNLSQLQVIKLLHSEKKKDKTLLYFLVGNRVINRLDICIDREQKLTVLLKNNPSQHVDLVDKLQKNTKLLTKNIQSILKDFAILEVEKLKNLDPPPKYFFLHRKEAEPDFMNIFIKELGTTSIFLFLSTGDEKTVGNILLYGDEQAISDLGNKVCELLEGKGAGKGKRFQAKVTKMVNRTKAEICISDYFT